MADRPVEWDALASIPSPMQAETIRRFAETGYNLEKLKECAIGAGYDQAIAKREGFRAIRKIANNPKMQKALRKQGVSFERLAQKLSDLLDAQHPQFEGKPDNFTQLKAVDMAIKIHDAYPSQKVELDKTETHHIIISADLVRSVERAKNQRVIDVEPAKGYFE